LRSAGTCATACRTATWRNCWSNGGVEVDHVTVFRWVQRFTPLLADAARFCRHSPGDRWFVDETYVKVNGVWRYVYRAVDQYRQVVDVLVSARRDADAAQRFFRQALTTLKVRPSEVVTDAAAVYRAVLDELIPQSWHHVEQHANNRIGADHSQLKHRLRRDARPMPRSNSQRHHRRARLHAEPSSWPLRARSGRAPRVAGRRGVHRARSNDLTTDQPASSRSRCDNATAPCRSRQGDPSSTDLSRQVERRSEPAAAPRLLPHRNASTTDPRAPSSLSLLDHQPSDASMFVKGLRAISSTG
jgi:transposase-like protein